MGLPEVAADVESFLVGIGQTCGGIRTQLATGNMDVQKCANMVAADLNGDGGKCG